MRNGQNGFSLIELIIYISVLSVTAFFLINILVTTTRVELQQVSSNDVQQQVTFVSGIIQRMVRESSLVENEINVATSALVLRMPSSADDPTLIYADSNNEKIYLRQGASSPVAITSDKVTVGSFTVTRYQNPGSPSVVQVNLTLNASTTKPGAVYSRTWRSAISRISAATFDSNLLASSTGQTIGIIGNPWSRIFLESGSEASPAYTFSADPDVGLFRISSDIVGLSTGGTKKLQLDNNGSLSLSGGSKPIFYIGTSTKAGCFVVGDSDGSGVTYITANNGVITSTQVIPSACQ